MKILLVGDANSIFLIDYTKWLKKTIDIEVHIFSIQPKLKVNVDIPYDKIFYNSYHKHFFSKIPHIRALFYPYITSHSLVKTLHENNYIYDIIHYHWMASYSVLNVNKIKLFCKQLFITFWGGEWCSSILLYSHTLYINKLKRILDNADLIIQNSDNVKNELLKFNINISNKYGYGTFGSAPLENLYKLIDSESKLISKQKLGLPLNKITVVIGYSGKPLHNHINIINSLEKSIYKDTLKKKVILLAPMTYGCGKKYRMLVEDKLKKSGFEYLLFKNYWTTETVARFRNSSDIVLQLSKFDELSRSILEFLSAGSILISGSWINYKYFSDEGFKFIETDNNDEAINVLKKITDDFYTNQNYYKSNIENGKNRYLWKDCIKLWIYHYKEFIDNE
ncbi:MAG: glycosyltransferase [Bacteroidales bacterium]|nr:glycosyltransferase [Bacteroidales bacterium]